MDGFDRRNRSGNRSVRRIRGLDVVAGPAGACCRATGANCHDGDDYISRDESNCDGIDRDDCLHTSANDHHNCRYTASRLGHSASERHDDTFQDAERTSREAEALSRNPCSRDGDAHSCAANDAGARVYS